MSIYPPEMGPTQFSEPPMHPNDEDRLRRASLLRRLTVALVAMALLISYGISVYSVIAIRHTQQQNSPVLAAIRDCTDTGGKCHDQGVQQTADAVTNINHLVVLTAACSLDVPSDKPVAERITKITSCVTKQLQLENKH